ncbi:uncharacterized protein BDR25DRAFT_354502 [Lindgomyces ingoldianus]|uniref:Uncharacterized protein n=1 Tax=Lindgomyces ingoldianus TaxID=673940 RepID=A0ACB6QXF3_9PLEO|nr:uncharacterized protein BDR25DRAFT_354502 [Lindgomyces ingoldianus]KAF2471248.1 hypothetical protein BDR25DRAFT_354502 [Lindgomyces ingoldianus]
MSSGKETAVLPVPSLPLNTKTYSVDTVSYCSKALETPSQPAKSERRSLKCLWGVLGRVEVQIEIHGLGNDVDLATFRWRKAGHAGLRSRSQLRYLVAGNLASEMPFNPFLELEVQNLPELVDSEVSKVNDSRERRPGPRFVFENTFFILYTRGESHSDLHLVYSVSQTPSPTSEPLPIALEAQFFSLLLKALGMDLMKFVADVMTSSLERSLMFAELLPCSLATTFLPSSVNHHFKFIFDGYKADSYGQARNQSLDLPMIFRSCEDTKSSGEKLWPSCPLSCSATDESSRVWVIKALSAFNLDLYFYFAVHAGVMIEEYLCPFLMVHEMTNGATTHPFSLLGNELSKAFCAGTSSCTLACNSKSALDLETCTTQVSGLSLSQGVARWPPAYAYAYAVCVLRIGFWYSPSAGSLVGRIIDIEIGNDTAINISVRKSTNSMRSVEAPDLDSHKMHALVLALKPGVGSPSGEVVAEQVDSEDLSIPGPTSFFLNRARIIGRFANQPCSLYICCEAADFACYDSYLRRSLPDYGIIICWFLFDYSPYGH